MPRIGGARRRLPPSRSGWLLVGGAGLIAVILLSPLWLLVIDTRSVGWSEVHRVLFRERSWFLLRHTLELSALVVTFAAVIGTATAWCTERTALPGRRFWTVMLVLPVALPDFVVGYAWHTIDATANGLAAATLVMTLGTFPLVYLPVAAALRRADPGLEETSRSLGRGSVTTLLRVTLPTLRTAIAGGCLLVVLTVLSEYGAFEILRYQTFTTEIFTEFQFDAPAAGALSIPLVLLGLLLLGGDTALTRRRPASTRPRRSSPPRSFHPGQVPVLAGLTGLVLLGVGVPLATLGYWMVHSQHTTLPASTTLVRATTTTLSYSALGALLAVAGALPVGLLSARRSSATRTGIERATFVTQALPGVVVALSLVYFATRYDYAAYHSSALLVGAYAILHFPLALVCVKASVAQAPAVLADIGQSLGRGRITVFVRITLPLLLPGLAAGFCLVFLTAVTELTATLVLLPIGSETLATQFWAYQSEVAYGAAAPYALVIIVLAAIPGAILALWFDRDRRHQVS